jgi:hypothetical protein
VARDQRRRRRPEEVVDVGAVAAADLQHVAEPGRRDQPGAGALLLEDRVDGERAAVDQALDVGVGPDDPVIADEELAADRVAVRRLLVDRDVARALVEQHVVDERAADVDGQAVGVGGGHENAWGYWARAWASVM